MVSSSTTGASPRPSRTPSTSSQPADVEGALEPKTDELPRLQSRHQAALRFFHDVKNKNDLDACVAVLEDADVRHEFDSRTGVDAPKLVVKDQQKRWGSCDQAGTIRLNWKIIQAPMRLVDYVVAHELVHLIHTDHTKAFWARLGRAMPDYDRRKENTPSDFQR